MHARWISFLQRYDFVIKHQAGKANKGADALSHKGDLLTILCGEIVALKNLPDLYENDIDFGDIWFKCSNHIASNNFYLLFLREINCAYLILL